MAAFLSNCILPVLLFLILFQGFRKKINMYEAFVRGGKEGLKIVLDLVPTLVGLMVAVAMMRESGLMEQITGMLAPIGRIFDVPMTIFPVLFAKMFSSSAATGVLLDIFKEYGTDSLDGYIASLLLSSTETVFYTMSVYYLYVDVRKTRWTLPGALVAIFAGAIASILIGKQMIF